MAIIKIAIAGIGNCAASLIQGLHYYSDDDNKKDNKLGLLHEVLAGLKPKNIEVVAAFDVDERKVGKDLADAIFAEPNVPRHVINIQKTGVIVQRGETKDGIINETKNLIKESQNSPVNVAEILKESSASMLLCTTPSGAQQTAEYYAKAALEAGTAFINATPCSIATNEKWQKLFKNANIPLIGDDLMDQAGATILHKLILQTLKSRGIQVKESYALDVGGGVDSLNTISRMAARETKRLIKSKAVLIPESKAKIVAGTTDYVEHLGNARHTQIWIAGNYFNDAPLEIDMIMRTYDGDNGGAVLLDVIRATYIALLKEIGGPINEISAYGFKNPPGGVKTPDDAETELSKFILGS
ncbi:MAG: inositol-3-phosphate synthase [Promethearchaeota archaeon]